MYSMYTGISILYLNPLKIYYVSCGRSVFLNVSFFSKLVGGLNVSRNKNQIPIITFFAKTFSILFGSNINVNNYPS